MASASVPTFTGTFTTSLEPSGYVTSSSPVWWPAFVVSTGVFQLNWVSFGRSVLNTSVGFNSPFNATSTAGRTVGVMASASVPTFTGTSTTSFEPSGYVTSSSPVWWPAFVVSTGVFQLNSVFFGNPELNTSFGFSSPFKATSTAGRTVGVMASASVPTFTGTSTTSLEPSGYVTSSSPV